MNKACPFCGKDKLKVELKSGRPTGIGMNRCIPYTASVRCNCCHSRGPTATKKLFKYKNNYLKFEEAVKEEAYKLWNSRIQEVGN